jgi:hypothetical protein
MPARAQAGGGAHEAFAAFLFLGVTAEAGRFHGRGMSATVERPALDASGSEPLEAA